MSPLAEPKVVKAFARVAIIGPSGSGKSWTALEIALGLCEEGKKIAVIDTERGSMNKYYNEQSNEGRTFKFLPYDPPLEDFSPANYIRAIEEISRVPDVGVLIIDSLSHAWSGKGGALEQVNNAATRGRTNNQFAAWRDVTPLHNRLIDTMIGCPFHLIVTMRSKMEYAMEKDERTGRTSVVKLGLSPDQRSGMEYEFDIVADMTMEHTLLVSKTRMRSLKDAVIKEPSSRLGRDILAWCDRTSNLEVPTLQLPERKPEEILRTDEEMMALAAKAKEAGITDPDQVRKLTKKMFGKDPRQLTVEELGQVMNQYEGVL